MRYCIVILIIVLGGQLSAQKGILKSADRYFEAGLYLEAQQHYDQYGAVEKDRDAVFRRGICNYYNNNIDAAIADLTKAYTLEVEDPEVYYYVGRALHSKGDFTDAVRFYKNYLRETDDENHQSEVIDMIRRCATGIKIQYNEQLAFVENLGPSVNTEFNEVHPVQSPSNQNKYYFSSDRDDATGGRRNKNGLKDEIFGTYSKDMYAVELNDGNWTAVSAFHPLLNSAKDDELMDFNPAGDVMYYQQYRGDRAEILTDTFKVGQSEEDQYPSPLSSPAIADLGDKDLSVFNDSTILFASKRAGGYGGYDLYVSVKSAGRWQAPVNLGPEVNSAYNDVGPFLARSGTKLYFSSDRVESMGGYDIFVADYSVEGELWNTAVNIGLPINSGRDDLHYSLSADGTIGVFASDRTSSKGGFDLYMAYMKNQVYEQLMYTEAVPFTTNADVQDSLQLVAVEEGANTTPTKTTVVPVKAREYYNTPLYYDGSEIVLTSSNTNRLDALYDILVIFPETKVLLTAYSLAEGMTEFDLYFSIKRAEKAADYLIEKGVKADRLYVRGLGANFPLVKDVVNGRVSRLAEKNNRRIEVTILDADPASVKVVEDMPIVSDNLRDGAADSYKGITEGVSFKVLISTVKQMYKGDVLKKYSEATIEKRMDSEFYDYTIGVLSSYDKARLLKNTLMKEGLVDATVLAYLNGKVLMPAEAEAMSDQYPELTKYLQYE